jgi:2-polyprenyl-6-methoxyphenol hydroxylase-like FAD-dependent oxidoreductase
MQVVIVGGGIAGLSFALSLHQIGVEVRIYESVRALEPLGLGINLQPNAVRELSALGLGDALAARGILTAELAFFNKHGQQIWSEVRGKAAGYRWPQISISRGDLQDVLLTAVRERLGPDALVTGHHLASFEERDHRVTARFVDPITRQPAGEAQGDLLIGADGIDSAVRSVFYPGEAARFDGYLHYRGIVEGDSYLTGGSMVIIGHRTHRVIVYPIAKRPNGKMMLNWLAYNRIPSEAPPLEDWNTKVSNGEAASRYEGWTYPWLDPHGLIVATERVLQFPNVDRDPIPRWSFGRVTLIGDAAHPMQPIGGQAGSQAIVDGRVLAAALRTTKDPVEALTRYQDRRIEAMNGMIVRNRNFGPESVMQLAEERAPNGFDKVTDVVTQQELEDATNSFKKAAGYDLETVNSHDSYLELPTVAA